MPYSIKKDLNPELCDIILRKNKECTFEFDAKNLDKSAHHRLYLTIEDRMSTIFKDEPFGDKLYHLIEDSLNPDEAELDRYCLDMSEKTPRQFMRCAVMKRMWAGSPSEGLYGFKRL